MFDKDRAEIFKKNKSITEEILELRKAFYNEQKKCIRYRDSTKI